VPSAAAAGGHQRLWLLLPAELFEVIRVIRFAAGKRSWPRIVQAREAAAAQNPRALAGRLRRAQTPLGGIGIEVGFSREGRAGSRIIRMHASLADTVSTVSSVRDDGPPPQPADDVCDSNYRPI
jgi:hypothetical protein